MYSVPPHNLSQLYIFFSLFFARPTGPRSSNFYLVDILKIAVQECILYKNNALFRLFYSKCNARFMLMLIFYVATVEDFITQQDSRPFSSFNKKASPPICVVYNNMLEHSKHLIFLLPNNIRSSPFMIHSPAFLILG